MSPSIFLQDIYIYPIKSLGGIRLNESQVEEKGLRYDRRWMLVDQNGTFVSQRKYPQLALLHVHLQQDGLEVVNTQKADMRIIIPYKMKGVGGISVSVWDDQFDALHLSTELDDWFSDFLDFDVRLVKMPETTQRKVDPNYAVNEESVSFADGMPYLLISQASLDDLNAKLDEKIPMNRFRPNLVFAGMEPFQEDEVGRFSIGKVDFQGIKLCARCVMTTVDQETGAKGKEPLKTLATYRQRGNKILFGQNVVALTLGKIKVGDEVTFDSNKKGA
ncbi:MOSC domain-containing protein [Algoriphagus vanfongensis]|uniref:MOSC domain-containing protein n=1 Tax=Algoriphagus vanfongensis TaxID=426371 RepID=UPI00041FA50D|nr:MOSC N-terminal beta barrel domain-containing protein [Algoriphagus vanfongensis]